MKGVVIMIEVKRKKGETFESFLRRFNKRLIQSKVVLEFKSKQYTLKPKSRNYKKKVAVSRLKYKDKMEYLKKTGRLPEEMTKNKRKY